MACSTAAHATNLGKPPCFEKQDSTVPSSCTVARVTREGSHPSAVRLHFIRNKLEPANSPRAGSCSIEGGNTSHLFKCEWFFSLHIINHKEMNGESINANIANSCPNFGQAASPMHARQSREWNKTSRMATLSLASSNTRHPEKNTCLEGWIKWDSPANAV